MSPEDLKLETNWLSAAFVDSVSPAASNWGVSSVAPRLQIQRASVAIVAYSVRSLLFIDVDQWPTDVERWLGAPGLGLDPSFRGTPLLAAEQPRSQGRVRAERRK